MPGSSTTFQAVRAPRCAGLLSRAAASAVAALPVLEVDAHESALDMLGRRGLVTGPTSDPSLGPSYATGSVLRDAGYTSLARAERAKLHLRLADSLAVIEETPDVSIAEVVARPTRGRSLRRPGLCGSSTVGRSGDPRGRSRLVRTRGPVASAVAAWETATSLAARAWSSRRTMRDSNARAGWSLAATQRRRRQRRRCGGVSSARRWRNCASSTPRRQTGRTETIGRCGVGAWSLPVPDLFRRRVRARGGTDRRAREPAERGGRPAASSSVGMGAERARRLRGGRVDAAARWRSRRSGARPSWSSRRSRCGRRSKAREASAIDAVNDELEASCEWAAAARTSSTEHLLTDAALRAGRRPGSSLPAIEEAAEGAQVHGLVETGGVDALQPRGSALVGRRWDAAIATGLDAVAFGEARDFYRLVVRSWFALRRSPSPRLGRAPRAGVSRFESRQGWIPIGSTRGSSSPRSIARLPTPASSLRSFRMSSCACHASTWITVVRAGSPPSTRSSDAGSRRESSTASRRRSRGCECRSTVAADDLAVCDRGSLASPAPRSSRRRRRRDRCGRVGARLRAPWWRAKASRLVGELAGDDGSASRGRRIERSSGRVRSPVAVVGLAGDRRRGRRTCRSALEIVPRKALPVVALVLAGVVVAIARDARWGLVFFHVVGGGLWTAITSSWAS